VSSCSHVAPRLALCRGVASQCAGGAHNKVHASNLPTLRRPQPNFTPPSQLHAPCDSPQGTARTTSCTRASPASQTPPTSAASERPGDTGVTPGDGAVRARRLSTPRWPFHHAALRTALTNPPTPLLPTSPRPRPQRCLNARVSMIGKRAKMGAWGDPPNFVAPVKGGEAMLGGWRERGTGPRGEGLLWAVGAASAAAACCGCAGIPWPVTDPDAPSPPHPRRLRRARLWHLCRPARRARPAHLRGATPAGGARGGQHQRRRRRRRQGAQPGRGQRRPPRQHRRVWGDERRQEHADQRADAAGGPRGGGRPAAGVTAWLKHTVPCLGAGVTWQSKSNVAQLTGGAQNSTWCTSKSPRASSAKR
jgi:hypothetical protein